MEEKCHMARACDHIAHQPDAVLGQGGRQTAATPKGLAPAALGRLKAKHSLTMCSFPCAFNNCYLIFVIFRFEKGTEITSWLLELQQVPNDFRKAKRKEERRSREFKNKQNRENEQERARTRGNSDASLPRQGEWRG